MKPEPDSQSGGKRPKPRRGFAKENRDDDALEKDLWDLDEPMPGDTSAAEAAPAPDPETGKDQDVRTSIPITPRSSRRDLTFKQSLPKKHLPHKPLEEEGGTSLSSAAETAGEFSNRISASAASDKTFEDLENSPPGDLDLPEIPSGPAGAGKETHGSRMEKIAPEPSVEIDPGEEPAPGQDAEDAAPAAPTSNPVKDLSKGLSKVERMGLVGFLVLLLGGVLFFFANSLNKLPEDQKPLTAADLPITGTKISADDIRSYWREPDASRGETVRRGTMLLPVVELGVSGGPGAVRIFFRDSDGATVGDGVTRTVNGEATVTIAATAGFDDQGMFAAYRTGETKPWKIEVYEGPSENAAGSEFKKLFEIPISTQRR